jgi:phospholipid transport system substrate-binding protein
MPPAPRSTLFAFACSLLAVCALAIPAWPGDAEAQSPATAFMQKTVDEVLSVLNDPKLDAAGRRSKLEEIAYSRFHFETVSKYVVARYWKTFSAEEKKEFIETFKTFLSRTYGDRIERYQNEQVEIVGERPEGRADRVVMTRIVGGNYDSAEVDYRLREIDGAWRVVDVKIEGISLVMNYRDQFKSFLARGGAPALLDALQKKNAEASASS